MTHLISAVLVTLFALNASADPVKPEFEYRIDVSSNGTPCETRALNFLNTFVTLYAVEPVAATCEIGIDQAESLSIRYKNKWPVRPTLMQLGRTTLSPATGDVVGAFETLAECKAQLGQQSKLLESILAIPLTDPVRPSPWLIDASCDRSSYSYEVTYIATFYVTALPETRLWVQTWESHTPAAFRDALRNYLAGGRGKIALETADSIYFYAKEMPSFSAIHFGYFHDLAQCKSELSFAQEVLKNAKVKFGTAVCETRSLGKDLPDYFTLEGFYEAVSRIQSTFSMSNARFASFERCQAERDRVIADRKRKTGRTPLGAVCRYENKNEFSAEVYFDGAF